MNCRRKFWSNLHAARQLCNNWPSWIPPKFR
jgi:hypothetical protein